jgi:hypothetical protein
VYHSRARWTPQAFFNILIPATLFAACCPAADAVMAGHESPVT